MKLKRKINKKNQRLITKTMTIIEIKIKFFFYFLLDQSKFQGHEREKRAH
jgi:hypothetical protein